MFCFVVAICDLVHAVEAMYGLPYVLTASRNLFLNMSDSCSITGIIHISEEKKSDTVSS